MTAPHTPAMISSHAGVSSTRTITLTGRAPIDIIEADWPFIARAHWNDGPSRHDAKRKWWLNVRQHRTDNRVLVYGGFDSTNTFDRDLRGGELLSPAEEGASAVTLSSDAIARAIHRVVATIGTLLEDDERAQHAEECIADLPIETI